MEIKAYGHIIYWEVEYTEENKLVSYFHCCDNPSYSLSKPFDPYCSIGDIVQQAINFAKKVPSVETELYYEAFERYES